MLSILPMWLKKIHTPSFSHTSHTLLQVFEDFPLFMRENREKKSQDNYIIYC